MTRRESSRRHWASLQLPRNEGTGGESRISAVSSMGLELTLVMMQIVSSVLPPRKRMTCVQVLRCEGRGYEKREEQ